MDHQAIVANEGKSGREKWNCQNYNVLLISALSII